jgi:hypothetical protein
MRPPASLLLLSLATTPQLARADVPDAPSPAASAPAPGAGQRMFDLKEADLRYTVVHKLHTVHARCRTAEGKAVVASGGPSKVQVRAKVACFDSGDSNRDAHMREVTHEPVHPQVTVKGSVEALPFPLAGPVERTLSAKVELAGESQSVAIPITLAPDGERLRGSFKFAVSLDGFKVERPSLLFIKLEDSLAVEGDLVFEPAK